ncbi:MAG: CvpA family protein [Alphaproteobacteria bacterium]|nr:CvpA family protein [Alphaproteobacteria bacterium]
MVLDLVVLGILLLSSVVAFMRGFVREVLTIGSLAGAAAATLVFGSSLTPMTRGWIIDPNATEPQSLFGLVPYEMLAPVIAYAITFVTVLIVLNIITHMVSKGVHAVGLGPVDRTLGVVFGLVRGVVIVGLLSLVLNFVLSDTQRETMFSDSKTYPYVGYLADLTGALMPGRDVLDKVKNHGTDEKAAEKVGQQPLEPGQARKSAGYSSAQRKKLEALVEQPQDQRKSRSMQFNN